MKVLIFVIIVFIISALSDILLNLLHPSGMALFGEYDIRNELDISTTLESTIRFLAITQQDNFLMSDSGTTYEFVKAVDPDSVTITHTNVWQLEKSLGDQEDYDENIQEFCLYS